MLRIKLDSFANPAGSWRGKSLESLIFFFFFTMHALFYEKYLDLEDKEEVDGND